jgi:ketosteroid isomerase-like protein
MSEQNVKLVHRGIDALNHGGAEAVIEFCDPEIDWIAIPGFLPDSENFHGHAGVRAWFEKLGDAIDDARWEAEEIVDRGERLLVTIKLHGSGRTSGIPTELRIFQAWTIRKGKLSRLESYLSRHQALEAAGLRE